MNLACGDDWAGHKWSIFEFNGDRFVTCVRCDVFHWDPPLAQDFFDPPLDRVMRNNAIGRDPLFVPRIAIGVRVTNAHVYDPQAF